MKNLKKLYILCIVTLLLTLMDGVLTFINTPDLKLETNPLISIFGLGWMALFIANAALYILYVVGGYFVLIKYRTPQYKVNNIREFVSQMFYGREDKFSWIFYKMPKNLKPFWASIAYAYLYMAPLARCILVFEWLMYTFDIDVAIYDQIRSFMPFQRVDILLGLVVFFYLIFYWVVKEYKKNQT